MQPFEESVLQRTLTGKEYEKFLTAGKGLQKIFLWIKKPGIAGDGKREQVAFHDRKLDIYLSGNPSAGI